MEKGGEEGAGGEGEGGGRESGGVGRKGLGCDEENWSRKRKGMRVVGEEKKGGGYSEKRWCGIKKIRR